MLGAGERARFQGKMQGKVWRCVLSFWLVWAGHRGMAVVRRGPWRLTERGASV